MKVLLIEDNQDIRTSLAMWLELEGFEVATAVDGEEGLEKFHNVRPDVAIVDIGLPKVNGLQILEEIAHLVPVYVLSGTDRSVETLALERGARRYLRKPFFAADIVHLLKCDGGAYGVSGGYGHQGPGSGPPSTPQERDRGH